MKRLLRAACVTALHLALLPGLARAQNPAPPGNPGAPAARDHRADARALAQAIDRLIEQSWAGTNVKAAAPADDSSYLRRLHIDLSGRIPSLLDIRDFLDNDDPHKR